MLKNKKERERERETCGKTYDLSSNCLCPLASLLQFSLPYVV